MLERLEIPRDSLHSPHTQLLADLLHEPPTQPLTLLSDCRWSSVLEGWTEAHRQHDVCEFLAHWLRKSDMGLFAGSWQARRPTTTGASRHLDEGLCINPILLHLPAQSRGTSQMLRIQSLIQEWHRGLDCFQALVVAPLVLYVQLHRFQRLRGRTVKLHTNVQIDSSIQMPIFRGQGHQTEYRQYSLRAFIEHHGDSPHSGHYTACLSQDGSAGFWGCDDGRKAKWRSQTTQQQHRTCNTLFHVLSDATC